MRPKAVAGAALWVNLRRPRVNGRMGSGSLNGLLLVAGVCLSALGSSSGFAESAATQPATQTEQTAQTEETPQQVVVQMDDGRFANFTLDQAMAFYYWKDDTEKSLVQAAAQYSIALAKLEEAAQRRWGKDVMASLKHTCMDSTLDDDAQGVWTINGDHASLKYKLDFLSTVEFLRVEGHWKFDAAATMNDRGDPEAIRKDVKFTNLVTDLYTKVLDELTRPNGLADADALNQRLKTAIDKIQQEYSAQGGPASLEGQPPPPVALNFLDGRPYRLSEDKADVVILDFWATWCPPCVAWLPQLQNIQDWVKRDHKPVAIYAVNLRQSAATVKDFAKQNGLTIPVLMDVNGTVAQAYGISGIPTTVIICKGKIVHVHVGLGLLEAFQVTKELIDLVGKPATPAMQPG